MGKTRPIVDKVLPHATSRVTSVQLVNDVVHGVDAVRNLGVTVDSSPFPSNRHHRSNGDCLEGKKENYQFCSVQHLCNNNCTQ